jgi:carbon-monoxide dehydrogenase medium subunit
MQAVPLEFTYVTPTNFEYVAPSTVNDAISVLYESGADARILAGGQSILVLLRRRALNPRCLVDIKGIPQLREISSDGLYVNIGATVTLREIAGSPLLQDEFPLLASTAGQVGSVHIRNRATLGGHVAFADPAFDLVPVLGALGAEAILQGPEGVRSVPIEGLARKEYEPEIGPGELVVSLRIARRDPSKEETPTRWGYGFANYRNRAGEYPLTQAAVGVEVGREGAVRGARIFVGGAGPTVLRSTEAEAVLVGAQLNDDRVVSEAARLARSQARPLGSVRGSAEWVRDLVAAVVKRALLGARVAVHP